MKNIFAVTVLMVAVVFSFNACTLDIPYEWEWEARDYRVLLQVDPDDALVLLNGKLIGYAYEFATWESSLKLLSRNNELVIKREGYREEAINLYDYSTHRISINLKMVVDKDFAGPIKPRTPHEAQPPLPAQTKPAYQPQKEQPKTEPVEPVTPTEPAINAQPVQVKLEVAQEESAIYLNGQFWGISPKSGIIENLRLKPGKYTLEVVKPGFKTFEKKLEIKDQNIKLIINLEKKP